MGCIIQNLRVIVFDQLPGKRGACGFVNAAPIYLSLAVDAPTFPNKMLIFRLDVVLDGQCLTCPQFAAQMGVGHMNENLIRDVRIVSESVVQIVIHNGCSCPKGNLSVEIGEKIVSVVVMMLLVSV